MFGVTFEDTRVRALALAAVMVITAGCTEEDQRHLLTYEKPKITAPQSVVTTSAPAPDAASISPTAEPRAAAAAPVVHAMQTSPQPEVAMSPPTLTVPEPEAATTREPVPTEISAPPIPPQKTESAAPAKSLPTVPQVAPAKATPSEVETQTPQQAEVSPPTPPASSVDRAQALPDPASEPHCQGVARQRREDAAANGYDEDTQKQIFDGTYKDCMRWEATHS